MRKFHTQSTAAASMNLTRNGGSRAVRRRKYMNLVIFLKGWTTYVLWNAVVYNVQILLVLNKNSIGTFYISAYIWPKKLAFDHFLFICAFTSFSQLQGNLENTPIYLKEIFHGNHFISIHDIPPLYFSMVCTVQCT